MSNKGSWFIYLIIGSVFFQCSLEKDKSNGLPSKPNVILILTDDQGYGDLGCHGNPWIKTPNIDQLYHESIRFTDFHVGTTCAPTRAGLMTGKNCNKVGVWHTIIGRSLLKAGQVTMANIFSNNGYNTAMYGKWHLGDNYPFRPQDRGFKEVLIHGGGGVGQTPDYWNNDYFDDTYFHNGKPEKYSGYCTDIWFNEAIRFIEQNKEEPFFCYLSTNAPHSPYHVQEKYLRMYDIIPEVVNPNFYGMISNIDDNIGILREKLQGLDLLKNTIIIFMTDNGTAAGVNLDKDGFLKAGYNAGMRGRKGSEYEGGHRVPFFLRFEGTQGKDIDQLTAYTDVLPTLVDLCNLESNDVFDGKSLVPLIRSESVMWPDRTLVTDTQRDEYLIKGKRSSVMTKRWRLIRGKELYDVNNDPSQTKDVAKEYPDVVARLNEDYEQWWKDVSVDADEIERIVVDQSKGNATSLNCMDWHPIVDGVPPWNQEMIRNGTINNGFWGLEFVEEGEYMISLSRWPEESGKRMFDDVPVGEAVSGGRPYPKGEHIKFSEARIKLRDISRSQMVDNTLESVDFNIRLKKGSYDLYTWLKDENGEERGAYYVRIAKVEN